MVEVQISHINRSVILQGEEIEMTISIMSEQYILTNIEIHETIPELYKLLDHHKFLIDENTLKLSYKNFDKLKLVLPYRPAQISFKIKVPRGIVPSNLEEDLDKFIQIFKTKVTGKIYDTGKKFEINKEYEHIIGFPVLMQIFTPFIDRENKEITFFFYNQGLVPAAGINFEFKIKTENGMLIIENAKIEFLDKNNNKFFIAYNEIEPIPIQNIIEFFEQEDSKEEFTEDEEDIDYDYESFYDIDDYYKGNSEATSGKITPITCMVTH